ncbi:MAG: GIY-YIG nuclease family protein [Eubacteriales bacterium]
MDRKKELKQQYKLIKPDMGVFIIRLKEGGKCYLQATPDLRGVMNGAIARLNGGGHPNQELQKDWSAKGADAFVMEILERLAYNKDESKTDYSEELAILQLIVEEKMQKENYELYKKKILK